MDTRTASEIIADFSGEYCVEMVETLLDMGLDLHDIDSLFYYDQPY